MNRKSKFCHCADKRDMPNSRKPGMRIETANTVSVCLIAMICCALWGSAFPCIKIGYQLFQIEGNDVSSQLLFAGYRFTLAGLLTILIGSLMNRRPLLPQKTSWLRIIKLSLFQTVIQYLFFYVGLAHTTGVKASIIEASNVFAAILIASLIFRQEKLDKNKVIGCIAGFAGVVIININQGGLNMSLSLMGEGFILLSTIAYAVSSVLIKIYSREDHPVMLSGWQFLLGGIIMILCGYLTGGSVHVWTVPSISMLFYLSAVSAIAYSLWGILLKRNPVSKVAVFGFMNPVFGVILSALFLGEGQQAFGLTTLVALFLVCIGIYIVNKPTPQPAPDNQE